MQRSFANLIVAAATSASIATLTACAHTPATPEVFRTPAAYVGKTVRLCGYVGVDGEGRIHATLEDRRAERNGLGVVVVMPKAEEEEIATLIGEFCLTGVVEPYAGKPFPAWEATPPAYAIRVRYEDVE